MKTAVVFSGGGSKIGFELGAWQAIEKRGMKADAFFGVSCGALLSMSLGLIGTAETLKVLRRIKERKDILSDNFLPFLPWKTGFASLDPLEKLLKEVVKMPRRPDPKPFHVGFVDYKDGGKLCFADYPVLPAEDMVKWTLASSAIPVIMELIDGRYADGGVREQTPLNEAIKHGYDRVILILANPLTENVEGTDWKPSFPKPLSVAMRTADIFSHEVFLNDVQKCIKRNHDPKYRFIELVVVAPPQDLGDSLDFSPELMQKRLAIGDIVGSTVDLGAF